MAQRARGLAAADSRAAEPQRGTSCELACDDQRAGGDHERREDAQKSPFACLFPVFGSDRDGYQDQSDGQRHQGQQKQRFSMASPLERCDSDVSMLGFSALTDKSHGAACRYAQIHYAGRCRQ